ncbi:MAG TPA: hypothetical protein PKD09_05095 [Aggregatilinea sp.]|uniref:hypothetical protein n=1 Tax=Aggregatilinea sp. TaxID=2806333 RepID=UPI002BB8F5E8|nr:hypothetical protein [Aggregatilinea sp.]HML21002.1 hypothetical protein [Aggregatilinea sp.]
MAADIKSHVLRRDEKGFAGIPFKRLLLGGVSGGMTLILARFALGNVAFLLAVITFILALVLTGPRGGLPLWQRLLYRVRGSLMLAAERKPRSIGGRLGTALDMPTGLVTLDSEAVFAPPEGEVEADMTEWITFAHADEADHDSGLIFVERPAALPLEGSH